MKFEVLTPVTVKIIVFWDVSPAVILKTEAKGSSETLINDSYNTGFNILKIIDSTVHRKEPSFHINEYNLFPCVSSTLMPNHYRWN
jgi:hypothetical protein